MAHSFGVAIEAPVTAERVHAAFGRRDYWLDRIAEFNANTVLESLTAASDGTVTITSVQPVVSDHLPRLIARAIPRDVRLRHSETWTPVGDRRYRGVIGIAALGTLGNGRGTALLAPTDSGSRLTFDAEVNVRIPLAGGRIERFIAAELDRNIKAIQRFTAEWIAGHP